MTLFCLLRIIIHVTPAIANCLPLLLLFQSLKKEVDWGGGMGDEKSVGESSSDYARHSHDPVSMLTILLYF